MSTKRFRRALTASALAAVAVTALAACGGGSSGSDDGGTPVFGGTLTFFDPVQYDAWTSTNSIWSNSQVTNNLTERLIWQDPSTGDYKPYTFLKEDGSYEGIDIDMAESLAKSLGAPEAVQTPPGAGA